jgi:tetratricopeptide (TPR) repeat protein
VQPRDDESIGGVAPRVDESAFGVAPKLGAVDADLPKPAEGVDRDAKAADAAPRKQAVPAQAGDDEEKPRSRRGLYIAAGVVVLAAAGGGAFVMGVFGDGGAAKREAAAKIVVAQKALVGDVPAPLRKSITDLKPYADVEKPNEDAIAVEAELHLSLARLGVGGELTAAKTLLELPVKGVPSADHTRAVALRAALGGDVQTARHALNEMVSANPKDALSLSYLGWTELAAHDLDTAAKVFARAATAEPTGALYNYELGLAKERLGDDAAAKDAYNKAIGAAPDHARARIGLLRIEARTGDAAAATKLEAFLGEHAATLQPRERAELMVTLGQLALANARWSEAEERFKKALAIEPDAGASFVAYDAKLGLARARVEAGQSSEAVDELRKLLVTDLRGAEVRILLAQALIETQKSGEAEPLLSAVEKLRPKEPRLPYLRARLLLAQPAPSAQDREQAMTLLKDAVAADPHLVTAWADLARLQNEAGHPADAVVTLGKAADALAGDARGAAAIGAAYLTIGRPADAEARFRAVLAGDVGKPPVPEHLPIALGLGEALEAEGKLDAALQAYADAQALAPKSALLTERRAHLAEKMNKLDDARKLYEEALTLSPPTVVLRLAAASLAITQNRLDDARKLAEAAMKDDDRSPQASVLLARIELASGHSDEAVGLARRAVMLGNAPEAHLVLAQVLEQTNKLDDALAEYKLAEHAPVLETATLGHARVLVHNGATKDALVQLEPLAKASGVRGEAMALMADSYADLQQREKALHAYEEAARLAPTSADLAFKLGRAQLDASHREAGVLAVERAIKLADPKVGWLPEAYLLLGDGHRGHENDLAIRSYTKYLQIASPTAPMRGEAENQIKLLGGTPPTP